MAEEGKRNESDLLPELAEPSGGTAQARATHSDVKRLLIVLSFVTFAAVCVLTLRLLCVAFAGLLLGVFLNRLSRAVERLTRLPYRASVAAIVVVMLGLIITMAVIAGPQLSAQVSKVSTRLTSSVESLVERARELGWVGSFDQEGTQIGGQLLGNIDTAAFLGGAFSSITAALTAVFLIVFIGLFLALDPEVYRRGLMFLVPNHYRRRADKLLNASLDTLWWFVLGRLFAMTVVGISTGVALWLLGLPMAFTLGTIAGLISFVPAIGAIIAILPAIVLALQQGWHTVLYVVIIYTCIQAMETNVLTPLVQQKAVSVPPVVQIVAQVIMGMLVGIMGVIIATPLAALAIEWIRELHSQGSSIAKQAHPSNNLPAAERADE